MQKRISPRNSKKNPPTNLGRKKKVSLRKPIQAAGRQQHPQQHPMPALRTLKKPLLPCDFEDSGVPKRSSFRNGKYITLSDPYRSPKSSQGNPSFPWVVVECMLFMKGFFEVIFSRHDPKKYPPMS